MAEITSLTVRSFDLDSLSIFWKIAPLGGARRDGTHAILDYEFYVLRSGDSPEGPYSQIAGPLRDQYMIRDTQVSLLHKWRQYYYKIRIVHKPTGNVTESGPAASSIPERNLEAAEIIRLEDVLFRNFIGRKCWLFIARTFGPQCTCYDYTLGRKLIANHKDCFGTGYFGGYMPPIEIYLQIDPPGKTHNVTTLQEVLPQDSQARMISFPPVSPDDVIVESENIRWRVISVRNTERLRTPVHQELVLHRIPIGDVEYSLPINVDMQNLQPSEERNFTNSYNIDNSGDYSELITLFGKARGILR